MLGNFWNEPFEKLPELGKHQLRSRHTWLVELRHVPWSLEHELAKNVKCFGFWHVAEQQAHDEPHSLAISHLGIQGSVRTQHVCQGTLADAAALVENNMARECAPNVPGDTLSDLVHLEVGSLVRTRQEYLEGLRGLLGWPRRGRGCGGRRQGIGLACKLARAGGLGGGAPGGIGVEMSQLRPNAVPEAVRDAFSCSSVEASALLGDLNVPAREHVQPLLRAQVLEADSSPALLVRLDLGPISLPIAGEGEGRRAGGAARALGGGKPVAV
mmetsp:Transcript_26647/g.84817  ORF Transcript_26647/g.84817 Transcript_26647/m.84817 type:complete len:270 (+) Transcript_26647:342-1151(+)